jgi:hypothetical protein
MIWGIIAVFVIFLFILNYFVKRRRVKKVRASEVDELAFIRKSVDQESSLKQGRLGNRDEAVAHKVRKLMYDASFHEKRNHAAFNNILKELTSITKMVLQEGGQQRMQLIIKRVEQLCGNDSSYLFEYLDVMRKADL